MQPLVQIILSSSAGILMGLLLGLLISRSKNDQEMRQLRQENSRQQQALASLKARYEAEHQSGKEKVQILKEARDELSHQFKVLAGEIFEEKSRKFRESSQRELKSLLNPLGTTLQDFRKQINENHTRDIKERATLKEQIIQLTGLNRQISEDAENLTKALKGQSQSQGAWGEMILESVLEQSGLRRGSEYDTQVSFQNDEQRRLRPDAVVHIPGERDVVIDAKVSLTAYERFSSADSEEEQEEALRDHLLSIRKHLKELTDKDYSALPDLNTIDFVLMFIPIEGAFSLAVQNDGNLFKEAFGSRIVVVSPSTLFATLRTIENTWRMERQSRNSREIAKRAGLLYDKFVNFTQDLEKVGKSLETAQRSHSDAMNKLIYGKGNMVRKMEDLKELGARTGKTIPDRLLDREEA